MIHTLDKYGNITFKRLVNSQYLLQQKVFKKKIIFLKVSILASISISFPSEMHVSEGVWVYCGFLKHTVQPQDTKTAGEAESRGHIPDVQK